MLHTEELTTCPILADTSNFHFEGRCEDCDVQRLSTLNLGQVEDQYHVGRIGQIQFEAYMHVWALLSPTGSQPNWRTRLDCPDARRFARKLYRVRNLAVPEVLAERAPDALTVTITYEAENGFTYGTPEHTPTRERIVKTEPATALETIQLLGRVEHYMNLFPVSIAGTPEALAALDDAIALTTARYLRDWRTRWAPVEITAPTG